MSPKPEHLKLQRSFEPDRDHLRGGRVGAGAVIVLNYGDYQCPYCRQLGQVLERVRGTLGDRMAYVFRHFPNERAHPGSEFAAQSAEAAGRQDRFWEMHDALYRRTPPLTRDDVFEAARSIDLDMDRFEDDLTDSTIRDRVGEDFADGRRNGVAVTPTIFIDGRRYDGAWDFHSMLETLQRPLGARMHRTARAFAALPASAGLVLVAAAVAALVCANSGLAPFYRQVVEAPLGIGAASRALSLSVRDWVSDGLLTVFFLLVGLEIRRDLKEGPLSRGRAAILPVLCAVGGVLAPAAIYLALNRGAAAPGWSAPTSTGVAFTLGVLAVLGPRVSAGLRVFVAALAVVDEILSVLTLAVFYPQNLQAVWLVPAAAAVGSMIALNRFRVYAGWPYLAAGLGLWLSLHAAGVDAALAGVALAAFLPTRPAPHAGPLLAQAATALSALERAEACASREPDEDRSIEYEAIWEGAGRNLSAASSRLLSPADRVERAVEPWSAFLVLPLFAFTATGFPLNVDLRSPEALHVLVGVVLGLVVGKPLGVALVALATVKARIATLPPETSPLAFLGAAILCGVSDPVALLLADQAFPHNALAAVAKIGVLAGSVVAAILGVLVLLARPPAGAPIWMQGRSLAPGSIPALGATRASPTS